MAAIEARRKEVKTQLDEALAERKLKIGAYDTAPAWIGKTAWKESAGGKTVYFGVGTISGIKSRGFALASAENRAFLNIEKLFAGEGKKLEDGPLTPAMIVFIDWYALKDGTIHALGAFVE